MLNSQECPKTINPGSFQCRQPVACPDCECCAECCYCETDDVQIKEQDNG